MGLFSIIHIGLGQPVEDPVPKNISLLPPDGLVLFVVVNDEDDASQEQKCVDVLLLQEQ